MWRPSAGDDLTVASELSSLEISTVYSGAPVLLRQSASDDDTSHCPAAFETEVDLTFSTSGSELAAATSVTLVAAEPDTADFRAVVPASALSAPLILGDPEAAGRLRELTLDGVLTSLGSYGKVTAVVGYPEPASAERLARLATWPDTSVCSADEHLSGLIVSETQDLDGFTAEDAVAALNALSPRTLTWDDGGQTQMTFSAIADGAACARRQDGWNSLQSVRISISTDDARWNGSYTGYVTTVSYRGSLNVVNLQATFDSVQNLDFVAASGMPGLDIAAYEWANFELNIGLDIASGQHTGSVEVRGSSRADCSGANATPSATNQLPPCEAIVAEPLRGGQL
jgi:hypothetical protein